MLVAILIAAFAMSAVGILLFRHLAKHPRLLDVPNERSSHTNPTLRGGGLVIVFVCLSAYLFSSIAFGITLDWGYLAGAVLIAGISWIDDLFTLSAAVRLPFHAIAAFSILISAGPIESIHLPLYGEVTFGVIGNIWTLLWIVWMVNAYNFMDGIDGIAGIQAFVAGLSWAILGYVTGSQAPIAIGAAVAGSSMGFLLHNWNPAKVFMGDVGSAFLGFTFASLPLMAGSVNNATSRWYALAGVIFVWPFVFDTIFTFLKRAAQGERVWVAHRKHLYQLAVIHGAGHTRISLIYGTISAIGGFILISTFISTTLLDAILIVFMIVSAGVLLLSTRSKSV